MLLVSEVKTCGIRGVRGFVIDVETYIAAGIPDFEMVGLGDKAVHEAKQRVKAALINQGFAFPLGRIIMNLAPSAVRKEGTSMDLALSIGILSAQGLIEGRRLKDTGFIGELSLDGTLRPVNGVLPMLAAGVKRGLRRFVVPAENLQEAVLQCGIAVFPAIQLRQVFHVLTQEGAEQDWIVTDKTQQAFPAEAYSENDEDFNQVAGQSAAKRVLEIAASGGHNVMLLGDAGCGKTMLAKRFPGILPPMTYDEAYEVTSIYSVAGMLPQDCRLVRRRPFRALHSGVTAAGLVGGGRPAVPGEISLAHHGVLFLDEMTEMDRRVLDSLRQPLEAGHAVISRLGTAEIFPAEFILIGAANPCRCGKLFEGNGKCTCTPLQVHAYLTRISRPIADRIDLHLPVRRVPFQDITAPRGEASSEIRARVIRTRAVQQNRYQKERIRVNAGLTRNMIERYCAIDGKTKTLLSKAVDTMGFSVRGYEKILKIARTIADMEAREQIQEQDVAEALQYRWMDMQKADNF